MQTTDEIIKLSDPGEIGREEHNKGDRLVVAFANFFAWLFPILMLAICAQVVLRQAGYNQAWLDDFQWWLYGAAVMVGIAYAVTTNSHVRVDIFYDGFSETKKAKYEIIGLTWLFLPFVMLAWDVTSGYAFSSVIADEGSDSPNGLHNLWILKVFMNLAFILMAVAAWSAYVRNLSKLTEPTLFRKLFFALPSTFFFINLVVYYGIFGFELLTAGPDETLRDIGRHAIFDETEVGPWEIKYTVLITIVLTLLVLVLAKFVSGRRSEG